MDLNEWMSEYRSICGELGIDPKKDQEAAQIADRVARDRETDEEGLRKLVDGRDIVIFGAGPSLESSLNSFDPRDKILIAADGAVSALLERGIIPHINVTDLDGDTNDILRANRLGAITVVHAHGDNMQRFKEIVPNIKGRIVFTTQTTPTEHVKNFFGFTDGDRCVSLAKSLNARTITLIGFDYGDMVGKYSDPADKTDHRASDRKRKKLDIAKRLVERFMSDN